MKISIEHVVGFGGLLLGAFGLGYALNSNNKLNDISAKLGTSVDKLLDSGAIDIPDTMVQRAVDTAVERCARQTVSSAVKEATNGVMSTAKSEIHTQVQKAVTDATTTLNDDVKAKLTRCIEGIDISSAKQEVLRDAKIKAAAQFETDLQKVVNCYQDNLLQAGRIYEAIRKSVTGNSSDCHVSMF